jgi:hypothetical protein
MSPKCPMTDCVTLSVGAKKGIAFQTFHLRRETHPVSEILLSVLKTRWWTNSRKIVALSPV